MKLVKVIDELKQDVDFAVQQNYKKNALQIRINRVNDLIDAYNEHKSEVKLLEHQLSEIEMDVFKHRFDGEKLIEKMFLIFEIIGISADDVKAYLRKSKTELESLKVLGNGTIGFDIKKTIPAMIAERQSENMDFDFWQIMQTLPEDVIAKNAMNDYVRLKRKFGKMAV